MIFGLLIRQALRKAGLDADAAHLDLAKTECNFIIQDYWYMTDSKFRQSRGTINTVSGSDEYVLNKHFDEFVKNTLQGPNSNPRFFTYLGTEEFFGQIQLQSQTSGEPSFYTYGDTVGYDAQLTAASKIRVNSALASKTTGTVNLAAGSDIVTSSTDIFTLNDVGRMLKKSGDSRAYKIGKFISSRKLQLLEKYRGTSQTGASYEIGDVGIHVNIMGYVGGEIDSEDIVLEGDNYVVTTKTFNSVISISKSDKTGGKINIQNESGTQTIGTLGPGETEIERQTVLFWPKPNGSESLKYRFYMKHPALWLESDRLLIPEKWHRLICYKLEKRLREFSGKEVPQGLIDDISRFELDFENEAQDLSLSNTVPGEDGKIGGEFWYDKIDERGV